MITKNKITAFLILCISAFMLFSCQADNKNTELTNENTPAAKTEINPPEPEEFSLDAENSPVEAFDYKGYEFTMLISPITNEFSYYEMSSEEENGEILNDAIYSRNLYIEDKYNIKLNSISCTDFPKIIKAAVNAGEDIYGFATPSTRDGLSLGTEGYLTNLHNVPHLDFGKPWWNKYSIDDTVIMGKNYFVIGKANLRSFDMAYVIFFNKKLIKDNSLQEPYDLVLSGEWTFDNMMKLAAEVSKDLNGNGEADKDDAFGLALNSAGALAFSYGTDNMFVKPNTEGVPDILIDERFITFFQKLVNTVANNDSIIYGERYEKEGGRVIYLQDAFEQDRLLFYEETFVRTMLLRNMETDFGVVPMPKSDSNQKNYSSMTHPTVSTTFVIPAAVSDLDRAGRIIEDIAYYSNLSVYPQYLESTVKKKLLRDEKSEQMVDLIISSQRFDLTLSEICSMPGDLRAQLTKGDPNVVSFFESRIGRYQTEIQKVVDKFIQNAE